MSSETNIDLVLDLAEFSDEQKQSIRETWIAIKAKGSADSLSTQQAVFGYAIATAMSKSLAHLDELSKSKIENEREVIEQVVRKEIKALGSNLEGQGNDLHNTSKALAANKSILQVLVGLFLVNLGVVCWIVIILSPK